MYDNINLPSKYSRVHNSSDEVFFKILKKNVGKAF